MHIAILGRQPELSIAELERLYGSDSLKWFSDTSAIIDNPRFDFERLGGCQKAGRVLMASEGSWAKVSKACIDLFTTSLSEHTGKITLGISVYGFSGVSARDVQKLGLTLKGNLRRQGRSVRLVPNQEAALNTAASHHNKLGLSSNKVEIIIIQGQKGMSIIAESVGSQNITSLARRDQGRPKRDAYVGMLPPKLARMIVNLALGDQDPPGRVLDPFCGTGVILQEAALMNYDVYGTDLSERMIEYSKTNLAWLKEAYHVNSGTLLTAGDAMQTDWTLPIDAVACEGYLGQPFSAPPSPKKLEEVRGNCNHIISRFLENIAPQLASGTPLCIAVPAWRSKDGTFTHLPLTRNVEKFGFQRIALTHTSSSYLMYYRESQVVGRELLLLRKVLTNS